MLKPHELEMLRTVAKGVAAEFGSGCEVVVHEISPQAAEHSLAIIENGHVTGRKAGDGPSQVVLEQLQKAESDPTVDRLSYLTRTPSGKLLKSSTVFLRGEDGRVCALFGVNFDISALALAESVLSDLTTPTEKPQAEPDQIPNNVSDLLDSLIERSVKLTGKPVDRMTKEDKVTAIRFLADSGAMLITKSGDKIAKYFGISKYTLYSYLDTKQEDKHHD
ncbi:MAG: transcriptional regulator [Oscillospiraceae bacterium]|nr:transcriptional regulator [Oscillospiraceae bacterium]